MTYNTEKRAEILAYLEKNGSAPKTIPEICSAVLSGEGGQSTVYRIVSKLVDEGSLRKISDSKTRGVTYQYIHSGHCAEHLHLKCRECGEMLHLGEETSHAFESRLLKEAGFSLDEGALIYGKCRDCKLREERAK